MEPPVELLMMVQEVRKCTFKYFYVYTVDECEGVFAHLWLILYNIFILHTVYLHTVC